MAIQGSCLFSDVTSDNQEYIILADNTQATAVKLTHPFTKTNISYPSSEVLDQPADLLQEFGTVKLRQKGKTAWTWDGDLGGGLAFAKVASGTKTQPAEIQGEVTITTNGKFSVAKVAHGLSDGDKITIVDAGATPTLLTVGDEYIVQRDSETNGTPDDDFQFFADVDDTGTGNTLTVRAGVSLGGGYINQPGGAGTDLAQPIYHQRRVWMPYAYTDAATPVARDVRDEVIASDLLDGTTFDPIGNQFVITAGIADFLVAMHGFDDDRIVVFMRNSIHQLKGVSGSLNDVQTIQLSAEYGCAARKSVANYANQILFLSDEGVYAIQFLDEYNLRGTELPLSEAIDPLIKRITRTSYDKCIGVVHDNKYWLACPIDGSTENNAILIYSFLNGGWTSIDTTNADNWEVIDMIPARAGKVNELYAITATGGIHKLDNTGKEKDKIAASAGQTAESVLDIPAALTTRQYTFGSLRRKKFNRFRGHFKSDASFASDGTLSILTEDPDSTTTLKTLGNEYGGGLAPGEDGTVHARIGNPRGFASQFKFAVTSGKPSVRAVQIDAVESMESTITVS